jgi:sigma-B regulation protein RsbU (phosphoserine phosphatase)
MALTFSLLRAETEQSDDPYQILVNVNRYLLKMNASGMFVTLLYGILDCRTGLFNYARSGHLPPIILDQDGSQLKIDKNIGQPLGLFDKVEVDLQSVVIPPGGLALLYSDGLNEATDSQGNELGITRIIQELTSNRHENAKTMCRKLWNSVKAHSGDLQHQDDFVTVIIKRHQKSAG